VTAETTAAALGGAKKIDRLGKRWACLCPAHDDHDPSLHLTDTDDGDVMWICRAGCDQKEIGRILYRRNLLPRHVMARLKAKKTGAKAQPEQRGAKAGASPSVATKPADSGKPLWLFDKALPIKGSPAERYLIEVRGSRILPPRDAVRFMPAWCR
jgi:hypothetical protein